MTPEEFETIKKRADTGDPAAMQVLGMAYLGRDGTQADKTKFFEWIQRAAATEFPEAMYTLGVAYSKGDGTKVDDALAYEWTKRAAEVGHVRAMNQLASAYWTGNGTAHDEARFIHWTKRAAEAGDPNSMHNLAIAYYTGKGVERDDELRVKWLIKAAKCGLAAAMNDLAIVYRDGIGVAQNQIEKIKWLKLAIDANYPDAMYSLALAYKTGKGVERDDTQFFEWLQRAANNGSVLGMRGLATAYQNGDGTEANEIEQFNWEKRAAETGDSIAMYNLGIAYRQGTGTKPDLIKFFEWTKRSAEAGELNAMQDLSLAYLKGTGTKLDENLFNEWAKRAADAGHPEAIYNFATTLYLGQGIEPNFSEFYVWMQRAVAAGSSRAFVALGLADLQRDGIIDSDQFPVMLAAFYELRDIVEEIKSIHVITDQTCPNGVAHFTTLKTLRSMLPDEGSSINIGNHLRLYNAAYMNDPQEGHRLLDIGNSQSKLLGEYFDNSGSDKQGLITWNGREYSVYIGAFTLEVDRLDLWRAYGNDGDGYCIVTPLSVFSQPQQHLIQNAVAAEFVNLLNPTEPQMGPIDAPNSASLQLNTIKASIEHRKPLGLYHVVYNKKEAVTTLEKLEGPLLKIKNIKAEINNGKEKINALVQAIISDIIFLYKNDEYRTEKEARMVVAYDISAETLEMDDQNPPHIFTESEPFLFNTDGSRIIIGPKVEDKTAAELYLNFSLSRNGYLQTTLVERSKVRYR